MSEIIVKQLSEDEIQEKGIRSWSTWSCDKSDFPWEYSERETCYIIEGQVDVETENGETVSIGAGDYVIFPQGIKCTWHVHQGIYKHFAFG
ncbi:MAG: cupin domain-containing protein [Candidatus Marinimicrobia bacterium]|jgi:hypothetical protein|nr:cupin domain-containing protein [Candidatus Neomarinimicrobiota bacterium]MBT3677012.1 cupin domain-containing protein [Candidatus Neomarinimicrobiota bacterium]MBT3763980.1 cupin domain-containing protein [Candidatus Neomarinimicrobiota bacterium]MBT4069012.1 cupin domain-containing protein [Candidatus Neomarinimicrobiota bacterium]MBT4271389.1 cupin domain-containing protein [Candidatus Neomarinimicrobiota bacterium]